MIMTKTRMMSTTTTTTKQQPEKEKETTTTAMTTKRHKWGKQRHFPRGAAKVSFARSKDNEVHIIPQQILTNEQKSQIWFSSIDLKNIQKRAYEMSQRLLDDSNSATTKSRPSLVQQVVSSSSDEDNASTKKVASTVSSITTTTQHTLDAEIEEKYGDSGRGLELINQFHERQRLSGQSAKCFKQYSRTSNIASIVWSLNMKEEEDSKGAEDDSTNFKPSTTKNYLPAKRESIMIAHAYCLGSEKSMRRATKIAQLDKQYVDEYVVDFTTNTNTTTTMNNNTNGGGNEESDESSSEECINGKKINLNSSQIQDICCRLLIGLKVQDRTFHFKTYGKCFVASEAVDFMIETKIATSRNEAVLIGKYLQTNIKLWYHVCKQHDFQDEYLFFRFSSSTQINETISNLTLS